MKNPKEGEVVKVCLEYLQRIGCMAWRNNTRVVVSVYKGKRSFTRFGVPGSPDIFAIMPGSGRFLGVECKMSGKTQASAQIAWQAACEVQGGLYVLATSLDELIAGLRGD